jgi:tRNA threonylcarbamoyladenosine biosynthesis protein TsaB
VNANVSPLLLALDTSTSSASVALFDGQRVLSETTWLAGREHSTRLLVEVDAALERVGKTVADLTGLVVARGPGSFTGVRVAISVAKGMAAGLSIPVWGVSSLDVLAHAAGQVNVQVRATLEAGRGRYATALYVRTTCVQPPRLATVEQLAGLLDVPTVVIGELSPEHRAQLELLPLARLASPAASLRRAGFVAQLGWQVAQSGDPGAAAQLDALYVT